MIARVASAMKAVWTAFMAKREAGVSKKLAFSRSIHTGNLSFAAEYAFTDRATRCFHCKMSPACPKT